MQAHGAEMIRIAAYLAVENGVRVGALVHDAMYIEAPLPELDRAIETTRRCMARASEIVLGFAIRTYAAKMGFVVAQEFVDVETTKTTGRTGFTEMLNFFKKESTRPDGQGCRILLVEKADRLYRTSRIGSRSIKLTCKSISSKRTKSSPATHAPTRSSFTASRS